LSKVRRDLNNYLDRLGDKTDDDGRREKETPELDKLTDKITHYRDLVAKAVDAVDQGKAEEDQQPTSVPVESIAMEDGSEIEIHGDHNNGFEIRRHGRALPTRFPHLDHAKMAIDIFKNRRQPLAQLAQDTEQSSDVNLTSQLNQDYIEEK